MTLWLRSAHTIFLLILHISSKASSKVCLIERKQSPGLDWFAVWLCCFPVIPLCIKIQMEWFEVQRSRGKVQILIYVSNMYAPSYERSVARRFCLLNGELVNCAAVCAAAGVNLGWKRRHAKGKMHNLIFSPARCCCSYGWCDDDKQNKQINIRNRQTRRHFRVDSCLFLSCVF